MMGIELYDHVPVTEIVQDPEDFAGGRPPDDDQALLLVIFD